MDDSTVGTNNTNKKVDGSLDASEVDRGTSLKVAAQKLGSYKEGINKGTKTVILKVVTLTQKLVTHRITWVAIMSKVVVFNSIIFSSLVEASFKLQEALHQRSKFTL